MKKLILCFFVLSFTKNSISQTDSGNYYINLLQYKKAINYLKKTLKKNAYIKYQNGNTSPKDVDMYNLACSYSLAKEYKNCIEQLNTIIKNKTNSVGGYYFNKWVAYQSYDYYNDPDFYRVSVNMTKEWKEFLINHKKRCTISDTIFKKLNIPDSVFVTLNQIAINDQAHYREINFYETKYGEQSSTALKLWKIKDSLNKANLKVVLDYIYNGYNVLSDSVVGAFSAKCFLVIQHADFNIQEKILPIIKKLYERKQTSAENYALLYDRISVEKKTGTQYYGTQINTKTNQPFFITDEKNVDKRRAELGMESMFEYCKRFNIIYKPKRIR